MQARRYVFLLSQFDQNVVGSMAALWSAGIPVS
jgi:hypothetical protein